MKNTDGLSKLYHQQLSPARGLRIAAGTVVALFMMTTGFAGAQVTPPDLPTAPNGYTIHGSTEMGGNLTSITGSGAMYDTLVNIQGGPRVFGQTFNLRALPTTKHTLADSVTAFTTGFGGDPSSFTTMSASKGKVYEFTGTFRRHREYFDYNLLGNPNIPSGQSIPIGPSNAPVGKLPWPQVNQSPVLFNTVRRLLDTNLTLFPISKITYHFGYAEETMEGPSLSPSYTIGKYNALLSEYQRHSTDNFMGAVDWKPLPRTTLTFEEQVDHLKEDSYFTLNPNSFMAQEADGTPVYLGNWTSFAPYGIGACDTGSMGSAPYTILSPAQTPGGLPIINPACSVATSYLRSQPTRLLYPTEIFRFQSSSIKNIAMNGNVRYTNANMHLPNYYENFQGLDTVAASKTAPAYAIRSITYTGNANAKREVLAVDYGINWNATPTVSISEQINYSNAQQPGTSDISTGATLVTPGIPNNTINYFPLAPGAPVSIGGNPNGTPTPNYFGLKDLTNNVTASWDGLSRATFSLTYRYNSHVISEGIPHDAPLAPDATTDGTVTIHENGGIFYVVLRPSERFNVNGSIGLFYADNAFTPLTPRQTQRYRLHALYQLKSWGSISASYNDVERRNNTNNTGTASAAGPLDHVDHSRVFGLGATLSKNEHYGFDFNYSYSDVYASTNICYSAGTTATTAGAASPNGTACPGGTVRGAAYYMFGPVKDFMDAPTQSGTVGVHFSPTPKLRSNLGYTISSVNGSRFYNDARDVAGSLVSTYQSPYVNVSYAVRKNWIWNAQYNYVGYGEGGPSGARYCTTSTTLPTPGNPAPVVACNDPSLAGLQTGLTISPAGETTPRNFHANNLTMGMRYEF